MLEHFVIIADSQSLRWQHFEKDLHRVFARTLHPPKVRLIEWCDVCECDGRIEDKLPDHALVRIESPARDFSIVQSLIRAGEKESNASPHDWTPKNEGWIASPSLMFSGLKRILRHIQQSTRARSGSRIHGSIEDMMLACDKNAASNRLRKAGVATPDSFHPTDALQCAGEMQTRGWDGGYVKLAHGSCASGILKMDAIGMGEPYPAISTVVRIDDRFHNTYQVRSVDGVEREEILNFLITQEATAQEAIRKSRVGADVFDVRMITLAGELVASIFRASSLPITNLHLGGYRADADACRRAISKRCWADAVDECERAAALFDIPSVGVDLAFDQRTGEPTVLEVNAFGDFFPNWKSSEGKTIHEMEIEHALAVMGR